MHRLASTCPLPDEADDRSDKQVVMQYELTKMGKQNLSQEAQVTSHTDNISSFATARSYSPFGENKHTLLVFIAHHTFALKVVVTIRKVSTEVASDFKYVRNC